MPATMRPRWRSELAFRVLALLVIAALIFWWRHTIWYVFGTRGHYLIRGNPTAKDWADSKMAYDAVVVCHHFERRSKSRPGVVPVWAAPGSSAIMTHPLEVQMYYVTLPIDQEKILECLRALKQRNSTRPIKVRFYAEENWITTEPGGGERGPEVLLREVTIE